MNLLISFCMYDVEAMFEAVFVVMKPMTVLPPVATTIPIPVPSKQINICISFQRVM